MTRIARGLATAGIVVVLDHATKAWLLIRHPAPGTSETLLSFLNLVHVRNTGVSFGLFASGSDVARLLLAGFALVIAAFFLVWQERQFDRTSALAASAIAGGAIGNAIDRLWRGSVVDFVDLHALGWHWPAFNVADSAITLGAVVLIIGALPPRKMLAKVCSRSGGKLDN